MPDTPKNIWDIYPKDKTPEQAAIEAEDCFREECEQEDAAYLEENGWILTYGSGWRLPGAFDCKNLSIGDALKVQEIIDLWGNGDA